MEAHSTLAPPTDPEALEEGIRARTLWAQVLRQSVEHLRNPTVFARDIFTNKPFARLSAQEQRWLLADVQEYERGFWSRGGLAQAVCVACGWPYHLFRRTLVREGLLPKEDTMSDGFTLAEQIRTVEAEINRRKSVFSKQLRMGTMLLEDAERELAAMQAVLETLQGLRT